ncbi:hypothetical protein Closa_1106 [[Clostridium] saccharolyticum WM1]|uniref:PcfK-like protein n=2 Tax=Lacrimispora TaxID=2719231 RepID=D9R7J3_LACSW|nr:PcfK-like family protein [Lacrimispora saccharolytica]ADL03722.1 hypothetical protein Closa_1106 [[Clostridium] saccharolyticum WM1]QRV18146.1 hypothetical protein I6K70_11245 [Lacrimispora saccharolytica]
MGVFSEINMEMQSGIDSPFEDEGAFEQTPAFEQVERLPVMPSEQTEEEMKLPAPQAYAPNDMDSAEDDADTSEDGPTDDEDDCGEESEDEMEPDSKTEPDTVTSKAQADAEEQKKRAEHEATEAKRKEEWEAAQAAKKAAEKEQLDHLAAMGDNEIMEASAKRVSSDTEKLTRRNMKECVSEYIQTLCFSDPAFARLTMQPRKTMIHCFYYINRKAMEFLQQEIKDNGIKPEGPNGAYGGDIPDDMCYQWAEEYFRDPAAEEDKEKEEEFVPKPYIGRTITSNTKRKKAAEKKVPEKKPEPEKKKEVPDGQLSLLDLTMPSSKVS